MKNVNLIGAAALLVSCTLMACGDSSSGPELSKSPEQSKEEILAEYSVAYEFDNPANIGQDFFGKNDAQLDKGMPALQLENDCLVLDGTSGLRVPLSDSFKSPYFVVEVRFMATDTLPLSNIFSADPPGAGVDGWMIRLDGSELRFHIRGAGDWEIFSAGKISLNEWHTVRVEFTKADMGELTVMGYDLKIFLDGNESVSKVLYSDAANLQFDLGIGYDPHHQSRYEDRFFIGKIDYIRYGNR